MESDLARAAAVGLVLGACAGPGQAAPSGPTTIVVPTAAASEAPPSEPLPVAAATAEPAEELPQDRSCCRGMNDCKGKGGCRTALNACAGKNECKGMGGCNAHCPR